MPDRPLSDLAWRLIVAATPGGVQGKAFWMSRKTWGALYAERPRESRGQLYSVAVCFDDAMSYGVIKLERRDGRARV